MKMVIIGGSGFIGRYLVTYFRGLGHEVLPLARGDFDLESADVVINLSGESVLGRWTKKKMEAIRESRLQTTRSLCESILKLPVLPQLYMGASAIGYYGDRPGEVLDESSGAGEGFLAELCCEWEAIPNVLAQKGVRVAFARLGIVLGRGGGLEQMKKAFQKCMGGVLGRGEQMMSWIAIDDVAAAMSHLISHPELSGPFNFVAPQTVTNRVFTKTLGKVLNRPTALSVPAFALKLLLGKGSELFLASLNVKPGRLEKSGYRFHYPDLEEALGQYLPHG